MTEFADRADALEAAIQDLARDIEAELAILSRYRGTTNPSSDGPTFRDPGAGLAAYEAQKAAHPGRVQATLDRYRPALSMARDAVGSVDAAHRAELLALLQQIAEIRSHDDAAALVATL